MSPPGHAAGGDDDDYDDDLEAGWAVAVATTAAVEKSSDLVAPLEHVSSIGPPPPPPPPPPLPLSTTSTPRTDSLPARQQRQQRQLQRQLQLPPLQPQHVVPTFDDPHHFQISPIASTKIIHTAIYTLDNARLTEPFSPDYIPHHSGCEESSRVPIDQFTTSVSTTASLQPHTTSPTSHSISSVPQILQAKVYSPSAVSEHDTNMFFGDLQRSSAAAHRRRSMATTSAITEYEADLTSKDRMKQKDAIKKILAGRVRDDWSWTWPREDGDLGTPIVNRSRESLIEEDWREREEWVSNVSETEDEKDTTVTTSTVLDGSGGKDPFCFNGSDAAGETLRKTTEDRKSRRRRRLLEEMRINDGLNCFTHRRNAWTGARHVHRRHRPSVATLTTSTLLKRTLSRTPKLSSTTPQTPSLEDTSSSLDLVTEIPIAPPILPPDTPMRKGINERAYTTIYEKVILQSQTPFCPINLSIVTKSCVEGWKRDGEWPPKSATGELNAVISGVKKVGLVSGTGTGKGDRRVEEASGGGGGAGPGQGRNKGVLRRSLQKVMGAVRERAGSKDKEEDEFTAKD